MAYPRTWNDSDVDEEALAKAASFAIRQQGVLKPLDGPLAVHITYWMPMIKSMPKWKQRDILRGLPYWHSVKPDISNLLKLTEDALNEIAWGDDGRISRVIMDKLYAPTAARQDIQVYKLEEGSR